MPKLYKIPGCDNPDKWFKRPCYNDKIHFDKYKLSWLWSNGDFFALSEQIEKDDWFEVVEKPKVEFKKFWKWVVKWSEKDSITKSEGFYDENKLNNLNNLVYGSPKLLGKIETDFIVCKKNNETNKWDFVRHSSQEITKEEVENEFK